MRVTFVLAVAVAGFGLGCVTEAHETWLTEPPASEATPARWRVELFLSSPPSQPHHDVALIDVSQLGGAAAGGTDALIRELVAKATAMGCDAVFVKGMRERSLGSPRFVLDGDITVLQAVCIAYDHEETVRPFRVERAAAHGGSARPVSD